MGALTRSDATSRAGRVLDQEGAAAVLGLYEASKVISSATDLNRGLRDLVNLLPVFWGMSRVTICLRGQTEELAVAVSSWASQEVVRRSMEPVVRELMVPVISLGTPLVVPDVTEDPLTRAVLEFLVPEGVDGRVGLIGVPIKAGGIPIGVLCAERIYRDGATVNFESDVRLLTVVGNLVGQAVCAHSAVLSARRDDPGGDQNAGGGAAEDAKEEEAANSTRPARSAASYVKGGRAGTSANRAQYEIENVIGMSPRMQAVFADLHQVAPTRTTVLLRGDSGTGKEMLARAVHYLSPRRAQPFIKVNCAALSETLLESELFGHDKGAFTGAQGDRKGRFELAHGGTLFLDEIGEISPSFQSKLLRVLQEGEFERVGGTRTIKVDVRLVAATNRNLEEAVVEGRFRADLYYRLNVVPIFLPPLRERREDIPHMVELFVKQFNQENNRSLRFSEQALRVVAEECTFPGNVRELENCVKRLCTMKRGEVIEVADFPCRRNQCATPFMARKTLERQNADDQLHPLTAGAGTTASGTGCADEGAGFDDMDGLLGDGPEARQRLIDAMDKTGWVQAKAARLLGLTPRQIGYALRKYKVEIKRL